MGWLRFLVTDRESLPDDVLERTYMTGLEEIPWQSRNAWEDGELVVARAFDDSGNVHVPWRSRQHAELTLTTATLMEREKPYQLEVELARGTLNTIRNQLAAWQQVGLVVPASIRAHLSEANGHFAKAATAQHDVAAAANHAVRAIDTAISVMEQVGESYTEQVLAVRRRQTPQLASLLGINLGQRPVDKNLSATLGSTFNTAVVPFNWMQIEADEGNRDWSVCDQQIAWAQSQGMKICGGPLLQFDPAGIPDWIVLYEDEFEDLLDFMIGFVTETITKYRGKVNLWQVAGRVNFGQVLALSEEQRLRIVVAAIETIRSLDSRAPVVVNFDQPWAECLAHRQLDLTPLHFADTLARADLGLAGLGLEINTGYWPGGTQWHSQLDYSRLFDRWSTLGLPLLVSLSVPSSGEEDPQAKAPASPLELGSKYELSQTVQRDWIESFVPLMLAKNCVQVVIWNQLDDRFTHDFPHGGLIDRQGQTKPGLAALRDIRQEYLT